MLMLLKRLDDAKAEGGDIKLSYALILSGESMMYIKNDKMRKMLFDISD
jgi:hypothetical protein